MVLLEIVFQFSYNYSSIAVLHRHHRADSRALGCDVLKISVLIYNSLLQSFHACDYIIHIDIYYNAEGWK